MTQKPRNRLKEIESGSYRDCYLIYNRKSMDEADSQKNSISYQKRENRRFAESCAAPIASFSLEGFCSNGVVSERHSGFKENGELSFSKDGKVQYRIDRPKFQQMVQLVNSGHFKGIVCLSWDRISRNRGDDTVIRKLMRNGVDIRFAYATYDKSSSGELHMDIDGMFSQHHSRVTSEKVTLSTKNNRRRGICTYRAPIGYLNLGSMTSKPFDPDRAPLISEMFNLYATGDWSLSDLARFAKNQGITTVPMRRRRTRKELLADEQLVLEKTTRLLTENHVSRILKNPFYTGRTLDEDGGYITSISHEPLVDDKTFYIVQELLNKKNVSIQYSKKLDHPLRGLVRCSICKRVYTPYTKKGILYFNARCAKDCSNTFKNCNFAFVANLIKNIIQGLHFTDDELSEFEARVTTGVALLEERRTKELEKFERSRKKIQEELAYLRSNRLTLLQSGAFSPEELVIEQTKRECEYDELLNKEGLSEEAMRELMKDIISFSELLKTTVPLYDKADPHQIEEMARIIFSELFLSQDTVKYKLKAGFEPFANRFSAICDPIAWLSELYCERELIRSKISFLSNIVTCYTK